VFTLRDGLIVREQAFANKEDALAAAGVPEQDVQGAR
jgi:hypothetical protein